MAKDDPVVGDTFEEALRANHNSVFSDRWGRRHDWPMSDGEVEVAILTTNELLNDVWGPAYRTKFEYVRVYNGDGMRVLVGDSEPGTRFGR